MAEVSCPTCERKTDTGRNCWWCATPIPEPEPVKSEENEKLDEIDHPHLFLSNASDSPLHIMGRVLNPGEIIELQFDDKGNAEVVRLMEAGKLVKAKGEKTEFKCTKCGHVEVKEEELTDLVSWSINPESFTIENLKLTFKTVPGSIVNPETLKTNYVGATTASFNPHLLKRHSFTQKLGEVIDEPDCSNTGDYDPED